MFINLYKFIKGFFYEYKDAEHLIVKTVLHYFETVVHYLRFTLHFYNEFWFPNLTQCNIQFKSNS